MTTSQEPGSAEQRFTGLYRDHHAGVLAYARRRAPEAAARDVTAEVFLVAWRRLDQVPDNPLPWLLRSAALVLANENRSARRADRVATRVAAVEGRRCLPDHAEEIAGNEAVLEVLRQLPPAERELLALTVWEGLDPATAAVVLGCSPVTARVRLHRGRRRLRALLLAQGLLPLENRAPGAGDPRPRQAGQEATL